MIISIVTSLLVTPRAGAMPHLTPPPDAGVAERVLHFAGFGARVDGELLAEFRRMMAHVAGVVAADFGLSPIDATRAVDLALDTSALITGAFDGSLTLARRPVRFEEDLRRAVLKAAGEYQQGLRLIIDGSQALIRPRAEILRHLGLLEGTPDRGLRLTFNDDRWRAEALIDPAWTDLKYTLLSDFAAAHLTKLRTLVRARQTLATLANSEPRAAVLAAMDEVVADLRRQILDLPELVNETAALVRERARARRQQQQQPVFRDTWRRLGDQGVRLGPEDWHRFLQDVLLRHGFEWSLLRPGPAPVAGCGPRLAEGSPARGR